MENENKNIDKIQHPENNTEAEQNETLSSQETDSQAKNLTDLLKPDFL